MTNPTILYQNIRSIKNKLHLIEALTEEHDISALCFTETWITKEKLDLLNLEGYSLASVYCRSNYEGGGVCILLKDKLDYCRCMDIEAFSVEFVVEISAIEVPKLNVLLIVIYWPNNTREETIFNSQLDKLLQLLNSKYSKKNVIIGGDLNVNFLNKKKQTIELKNTFKRFNFDQNVKVPTRIHKDSATCLDVIFTNFNKNNFNISVNEYGLSDHRGVLIELQQENTVNDTIYQFKRVFNEKNLDLFKQQLQLVNWSEIIVNNKNVNENYLAFHSRLTEILHLSIPIKKVKINNKRKSWLTPGIKKSCLNKRLLRILTLHSNDLTLRNHYKTYEKILKKVVIASKKLNYIKKMNKAKNKVKSMWQIIKERTNKTARKIKRNISLKTNNVTITKPVSIANTFNDYFLSVGSRNGSSAETQGRPAATRLNNSIYLDPISPEEVKKIITNLKNKTSYGFDEFPPILIKHCVDELMLPISNIINQSFSEAVFPSLLKQSIIKPIPKIQNTNDVTQFRPISLLSTFSKIIESVMCKKLNSFCEKYNIFNNSQHGFRKDRSTASALFELTHEILKIINDQNYAIGIMLDMSKAYDRVSHKILLHKLYEIGVRGQAHELFKSYLQNRTQCVEIEFLNHNTGTIETIRSQLKPSENSIPQGSVLGCILFLIYINDIVNVTDSKTILYADDITIVVPCQNSNDLPNLLNNALYPIDAWLKDHNLLLNVPKTKLIQFKPRQKRPINLKFSFNGMEIESIDNSTLLGVVFDSDLSWRLHIDKIVGKLSSFTYALYELKKTTDLQTATTAYYAYAHAWLMYGLILWGNGTDVHRLFILQKRCVRILVNIDDRESCRPYFKKLKILTLASMYILAVCNFVIKNKHLYKDVSDNCPRSRRLIHKNKLAIPPAKLHLVSAGVWHMSIKIYNHLPQNLREIEEPIVLNKKLKEFLITNSFYSLEEFFKFK